MVIAGAMVEANVVHPMISLWPPPGKIMRLRLVSVSGKSVTFATRQIAPLLHSPSLASVPRSDMAIISRHEPETASRTA